MWLQNTVRVQNCYVIILLIVYEEILIPRNLGNGWRMRMQVLPGLVVRRPGFEAKEDSVRSLTSEIMSYFILSLIVL